MTAPSWDAAAPVSGRNAKIALSATPFKGAAPTDYSAATVVGIATDWNLDITMDTDTIVCFGTGGWKTRIYLMSEFSGTAAVKWNAEDAGQKIINDSMDTPVLVGLFLVTGLAGTAKSGYYWGDVYFKSYNIKTPANGVMDADCQFEGNGKVTYVAPSDTA